MSICVYSVIIIIIKMNENKKKIDKRRLEKMDKKNEEKIEIMHH